MCLWYYCYGKTFQAQKGCKKPFKQLSTFKYQIKIVYMLPRPPAGKFGITQFFVQITTICESKNTV